MESQNNLNFIVSPQGKIHVLLYRTDYWSYLHSSRIVGECSSSPPRPTAQFHRVISGRSRSKFFTSPNSNPHSYHVNHRDRCYSCGFFYSLDSGQDIWNVKMGNLWLSPRDDPGIRGLGSHGLLSA